MISAKENSPRLTPEEYFAWEEKQLEKHEYIDGQAYAMSGGSVNHGRIAIRFTAMFDAHLEDSGCIVGNSDIKINIVETNNYTYPDASVTCDERDKSTPQYFTYPCLIVKVLSDSTEAYDRGGKFRMYRNNPVLYQIYMKMRIIVGWVSDSVTHHCWALWWFTLSLTHHCWALWWFTLSLTHPTFDGASH